MLLFTTILAIAAVVAGVPVDEGRIFGGKPTTIEKFPHQVSLEITDKHLCGGTLIGASYVVTAAACLYSDSASDISVRAGTTNRETGGVKVLLERVAFNPNFSIGLLDGDVGVLKLRSPLPLSDKIKPISLVPIKKEPGIGEILTVTGWGRTKRGSSKLSPVLQAVDVPAVDRTGCRLSYEKYGFNITDTMLCAGVPTKDSCHGDGGGPLINAKRQLVGIVSWGLGCGLVGMPGVYASVAVPFVHNFITDFVNSTGTQYNEDY